MVTDAQVQVAVDDRQDAVAVDAFRWAELLAAALASEGVVAPAEVGLSFVGLTEMTELNRVHMDAEGPTDVLAFPIDGLGQVPPGQPAMIGDVVICPEYAQRAPQILDDELALLVVHGALHLLGHDHAEPEETERMKQREAALLDSHYMAAP